MLFLCPPQRLGFIPEDLPAKDKAAIAKPLGSILAQLSGGGGAAKVNIDVVTQQLEELGTMYPIQVSRGLRA